MQKKQAILVVASLLVVVLSVTLAYFTAQIIGKGKSVTINSANLQIIFTDSDGSISGSNIEPGKWNVTKTFTIENKSNETYKYNIVIQDLVNTFVTEGYLQYKITSTNGGYNMTEFKDVPKSETAKDTILAYSASIEVGVTQTYTIEFIYKNDENINQNVDQNKTLSGKLFISEGSYLKLYDKILKDNPIRNTRTTFNTPYSETTTKTLFTSTENVTGITNEPQEVYYYAGNTTNNWLMFGGYYWRIIRTNHDGSIRLLYSGTSHDTTNATIGSSEFNLTNDDEKNPKYVGYKYGEDTSLDTIRNNTTDSTIKAFIDSWYKNNLTNYTKYLSLDAVYCNNRDIKEGDSYSTSDSFTFALWVRLSSNPNPSYNCTDIRDAFSVNNPSAKLDYPIALMTADELYYAGGVYGKTLSSPYTWFVNNSNNDKIVESGYWWLMAPVVKTNTYAYMLAWSTTNNGIGYGSPEAPDSVRPVISLKSCVKYSSGDGSAENPYTIKESTSGC